MRKYWIISTNCDCASDTIARVARPRCLCCNRVLGCMQYIIVDEIKAKNTGEALQIYREEKRMRAKNRKEFKCKSKS